MWGDGNTNYTNDTNLTNKTKLALLFSCHSCNLCNSYSHSLPISRLRGDELRFVAYRILNFYLSLLNPLNPTDRQVARLR